MNSLQIIARIQTPSANVRRTISSLLTDIGKVHPQAMVYPLTVASKSSSIARKHAAEEIMQRMREHSPVIVEQVRYIHFAGQWSLMAIRLCLSARS
jgi:FKBP12-rapamycin complex-associated protein